MGYLQNMAVLCDPFIMEQEIYDKINRAIEICYENKREISLSQEIREFVLSSNGVFLSSDVVKCCQVSSRREHQHVSKTLSRLADEGLIERYGKKNGCFRRIDKECEKLDWAKSEGEAVDLKLPFSLNNMVEIHPKNMIVIAGMANSGKTAVLLNIVALNLDRFKGALYYFSSEMGERELKKRIEGFGIGYDPWKVCEFYERSDFFADIINPDGINIIDYFEISDNFYKIGEDFKKINDKLNKGVAIIALQKNPDKKIGRGGTFSIEKPRLYLALDEQGDHSVIEIIKAKNYITDFNPKGYTKRFKITNKGSGLLELGNWEAPQYGR
jgi:hypothetical protein